MSDSIQILGKLLDACELRHRVLAGNLANANTPNYVRKEVKFKNALSDAIKEGDLGPDSSYQPEVFDDRTRPADASGNNVAAQKELADIAENSLMYGVAAKMLNSKYSRLKKVIAGK